MYNLPYNLPADLLTALKGCFVAESPEELLPLVLSALRTLLNAEEALVFYESHANSKGGAQEITLGCDAEGLYQTFPTTLLPTWRSAGVHTQIIEELKTKLACVSYSAFSWPFPRIQIANEERGRSFQVPREYTVLAPFSSYQAMTHQAHGSFFGYFVFLYDGFPPLKDSLVETIIALPGFLSQALAQYRAGQSGMGGELGAFAHDIKRHLLIMREFLRVAGDEDEARRAKALSALERTLLRSLHETNLRLVADRELGGLKPSPVPADVNELIKEAAAEIKPLFDSARVKLRLELEEGLPPVRIDPALFPSAILNLLDNALKFSSDGSEVLISTQLSHRDDVCISVIDSGVPIAADDEPHIFLKRVRGTNADGVGGNGLGLYLVRRIVEEHGGDVRLESGVGATKRFVIELPPTAAERRTVEESR